MHLIERQHSWQHINQVTSALRFFYGATLSRTDAVAGIVGGTNLRSFPRSTAKRSLAFSGGHPEVAHSRSAGNGLRGGLAYQRGAAVEITSIHSARILLHIENGEGGKDRHAMLSLRFLEILSSPLPGRICKPIVPPEWDSARSSSFTGC